MTDKIIIVGNIGCPVVTIDRTDLRIIEYRGQRVVTLARWIRCTNAPKALRAATSTSTAAA